MSHALAIAGTSKSTAVAKFGALLVLLLLASGRVVAADVKLAWDAVADARVVGYKLYYGPAVGNYPSQIDVGNATTYMVSGLAKGSTYHFVVTAYDAARTESGFSNDVGAAAVFNAPDVGLYRKLNPITSAPFYKFLLDTNFDHTPDAKIAFGTAGDVPLVGYINPDGKSSLVVYRNGSWYVDSNRDGVADATFGFGGVPGDIPLIANFSGPGALDDLVIYRAGTWYVDRDLNGTADLTYGFGGVPGDVPLAGDVDGDGMADLVIYRNGIWYIDTNRDGVANLVVNFGGMPQDIPLLFDWDGDGKADLCIFRDGTWYISTARDGTIQAVIGYGAAGDLPVAGRFH